MVVDTMRPLPGKHQVFGLSVAGEYESLVGYKAIRAHNAECALTAIPKIPGRVRSRINVSRQGMEQVLDRHFFGSGSRFSISERELRDQLASKLLMKRKDV